VLAVTFRAAGIEQSFFNYEELSLFFLESNDVTPIERF